MILIKGKGWMKCKNHPDREAIGVCLKHETGFCPECCECFNIEACCTCLDPSLYCKFRSRCVIWERAKERKKERRGEGEIRGSGRKVTSDQ